MVTAENPVPGTFSDRDRARSAPFLTGSGRAEAADTVCSKPAPEVCVSDAARRPIDPDELPDGDLIAILLRQHVDITDALKRVERSPRDQRGTAFESLKVLIKAHESAERRVLRPLTQKTGYEAAATARNAEEEEAGKLLAELTGMGADDPGFGWMLSRLMTVVADHARHEEQEEFPVIVASWTESSGSSSAPTSSPPSRGRASFALRWTRQFADLVWLG